MESIWEKTAARNWFQSLSGSQSTDVLIIGGGIAGLLCAHRLKSVGVECMLLEADEICGGITKNTTAKITMQHGLMYDALVKSFGEEGARLYCKAQLRAGKEYERLCRRIECEYEKRDSFVYSLQDREKVEKEVLGLKRLGVSAEFVPESELPFSVAGLVCVKDQAQFHPLKFLYAIAKDLPIFEHTKVLEIKPNAVKTHNGIITFRKLIIATHFPILNKHGLYFLKLYQHRSYVIALSNAQALNGMYVDEAQKGLSFRNAGDALLLGGGDHRTGKRGGGWQELELFAKRHYPQSEILGKWATQDCMTLDGIPYIGRYSTATPNFFVATGFQKWGMTNAMVAADVLCDLVRGKKNEYAALFSPSRSIWHPQLAFNILESTVGLLSPTTPRCPHLGCALKYNKEEHTWDCPCHGSRFTHGGELIDNPATDDLFGKIE